MERDSNNYYFIIRGSYNFKGYESGKTYWIVPRYNTNVALSVYGNTQVSQNRNVIVWSKQNIADQLWRIDVPNGYARIKSEINNNYALNIWLGSDKYGNCDIHTWSDNTNDSKINFKTIDASQNLYLIQCYRNEADNNLYLTAESTKSGSNVKWAVRDERADQIWQLIEKTNAGGGSTDGTGTGGWDGKRHSRATILVSAENQYGAPYNNYSKTFQSNACYIASLISAAHGLGRTASLATAMNEGCVYDKTQYVNGTAYEPGYVFSTPSFITIAKNQTYSLSNIYNQIKIQKRPVIVYGYSNSLGSGHYVVAYYTSASSTGTISTANTYVMDPWQGWVTLQAFLDKYPSTLQLRYCS